MKKELKSLHIQSLVVNMKEELEKIKLINNPISVISNENISFFSEDYSMAIHNSNAKKNARRIRKIFSPYFDEIQILMFTRAQVTIIPSFYAQLFNHITSIQPRFKKMSKWLETNFFEVLNLPLNIFSEKLKTSFFRMESKSRFHG